MEEKSVKTEENTKKVKNINGVCDVNSEGMRKLSDDDVEGVAGGRHPVRRH